MDKQAPPAGFRSKELSEIFKVLQSGESCTIVGVGSVGKSNLLRFLQQKEIMHAYLGDAWNKLLPVYVDFNQLLDRSRWGLAELMMHGLVVALTEYGAEQDVLDQVDRLHQRTFKAKPRLVALRYLDRAIRIVRVQQGLRLAFLFDEFDELRRKLSGRALNMLRSLRDDHKYQLMYVVAMRQDWSRLLQERPEAEPFEEIVSPHTIWLGPYAEGDALWMIRRLEARYNVLLDDKLAGRLLEATGGHPGLLRAAFQVAVDGPADLDEALASDERVADECGRIWHSLPKGEQKLVAQLVAQLAPSLLDPGQLERLQRKGIVAPPQEGKLELALPLFGRHVQKKRPAVGARLEIDHGRRMVWVDGRPIKRLTSLEYELLAYLDERRGQVISRDELITHLYPQATGDTSTDSLDSIVKRLRRRIEPAKGVHQFIKTVRGQGFLLANGAAAAENNQ